MSALLDERAYVAAIRALIDTASPEFDAYDYDDLPGGPQNASEAGRKAALPRLFALVSMERRFNEHLRLTGNATRTGWRLGVRSAGKTADECRGVAFKVAGVLNEGRLVVAERSTTPIQFESSTAAEWDDGRYVASSLWTFVH